MKRQPIQIKIGKMGEYMLYDFDGNCIQIFKTIGDLDLFVSQTNKALINVLEMELRETAETIQTD